jgi:hypothetical protein
VFENRVLRGIFEPESTYLQAGEYYIMRKFVIFILHLTLMG